MADNNEKIAGILRRGGHLVVSKEVYAVLKELKNEDKIPAMFNGLKIKCDQLGMLKGCRFMAVREQGDEFPVVLESEFGDWSEA